MVLFSTTRTQVREPLFQWACSLGTLELNLYALKRSAPALTKLEDAKHLLVATVREDVGEQLLLSQGFDPAFWYVPVAGAGSQGAQQRPGQLAVQQ